MLHLSSLVNDKFANKLKKIELGNYNNNIESLDKYDLLALQVDKNNDSLYTTEILELI